MKIKILANDGISKAGIDLLEKHNYEVITDNVNQDDLIAVSYTHLTLPTKA